MSWPCTGMHATVRRAEKMTSPDGEARPLLPLGLTRAGFDELLSTSGLEHRTGPLHC